MVIEKYIKKRKNNKKSDTYVKYSCDICGDIRHTTENNLKGCEEHLCITCSNRRNVKTRKKTSTLGRSYPHRQRENSSRWKGGKYINNHGYVMVKISNGIGNRLSGWEQYRPEHIVIMEEVIGRRLFDDECVHHIDGNRQNNEVSNLVVIDSNSHHRITHSSLQKVGYELYKNGYILYDKTQNKYVINENLIKIEKEL